VIGLVGGIGAGKSAAASRLVGLGAWVIDADKVGHALLDQRPVRERVVERFGPGVLDATAAEGDTPRINRKALGAIVFHDPAALRALEAILHPRMCRTFEKAIARAARKGEHRAVVLDAAILFEAGWDRLCDRVFFVDAPREARLARLAKERGWDEATLSAREAVQWPLDRKRERADAVLPNEGLRDDLRAEVDRAWSRLRLPGLARPEGLRKAGAPPGGSSRPPGR
jgi:dephospho-CoA kinase